MAKNSNIKQPVERNSNQAAYLFHDWKWKIIFCNTPYYKLWIEIVSGAASLLLIKFHGVYRFHSYHIQTKTLDMHFMEWYKNIGGAYLWSDASSLYATLYETGCRLHNKVNNFKFKMSARCKFTVVCDASYNEHSLNIQLCINNTSSVVKGDLKCLG